MNWRLELTPAARRDLRNLDPPIAARVLAALDRLVAGDGDVAHLTNPEPGKDYRLRVGDWRAVFARDEATESIIVARVRHRRAVYRDL